MKRKNRIILIIILAVSILISVYVLHVGKDMSDFEVCYRAGLRISGGETVYRTSDGHLQFKYSPASAVFFALYTVYPLEVAKFLWYVLEVFFLFFILFFSYKLLPLKLKKKGTVVGFSLLILLKFSAREIELGQVNFFTIFLFMIMFSTALQRKDWLAGFSWGAALIFKPYALIFFPYFILKKRFKLVAVGMAAVLTWFVLPVVFYSFKGYWIVLKEWPRTLSRSTILLLESYDNMSFHAFLLKILPDKLEWLYRPLMIGLLFFLGLSFLRLMYLDRKKAIKDPEVLEFSFLLILIPLFSPLGWYYNYFYSFLAVVILVNLLEKYPPVMKYALVFNLIIIGASLREVLGKQLFHFYTAYSLVVLNYLIILFYLFYSRKKKYL